MDHRRKPTPTTNASDSEPRRVPIEQVAAHEESVAMLFSKLRENDDDDRRLANADIATHDKLCSLLGRLHVLNACEDNPMLAAIQSLDKVLLLQQAIRVELAIDYWKKKDAESAANGDAK